MYWRIYIWSNVSFLMEIQFPNFMDHSVNLEEAKCVIYYKYLNIYNTNFLKLFMIYYWFNYFIFLIIYFFSFILIIYIYFIYFLSFKFKSIIGDWGLGIGDWGLGIGDWAQSPIPHPHYPNPQPPLPFKFKR